MKTTKDFMPSLAESQMLSEMEMSALEGGQCEKSCKKGCSPSDMKGGGTTKPTEPTKLIQQTVEIGPVMEV